MRTLTKGQEARTRRLLITADRPDTGTAPVDRNDGPLSLMASAARWGLATGLLELSILSFPGKRPLAVTFGELQLNRNFPWMIPAAHMALFVGCTLPLAMIAPIRPNLARRMTSHFVCGFSVFSLLVMLQGLYFGAAAALAIGIGYKIAPRIEALGRRMRRIRAYSLPILIGIVAVLGGLSYNSLVLAEKRAMAGLPAPMSGAPNVLLIVLDTVRADHLSLSGYGRDTTPNLARLARRGVVFNQARSTAPWTLPSHSTMFTGKYPHEVGVDSTHPLDATYPTLAEFLASHGYATGGFIGNTYFCNSWFGLGRGFVHYEEFADRPAAEAFSCTALGRRVLRWTGNSSNARPDRPKSLKDAEAVSSDFLRWSSGLGKRPFFAFLNYIDAHDPYQTPPGFHRPFSPRTGRPDDTIRWWFDTDKHTVTPPDLAKIEDAYDDCLAYLDEQLGRLFDELDRRGTLNDTLVIITSDHGEGFGEHGLYLHGQSLYDSEIHVPLIVLHPGGSLPSGQTVANPVSLRDLPATVADHLGLAATSPFPGRSLARFWGNPADGRPRDGEPVLSEGGGATRINPRLQQSHARKVSTNPELPPTLRGSMASLVSEGMQYIRDAQGKEELYQLSAVSTESQNLAASEDYQPMLIRLRTAFDALDPLRTSRK